jgi:hypothetical protein
MKKIIGYSIIVSIFGGLYILVALHTGWVFALAPFIIAFGIIGLVYFACWLIQ